MSTGAWPQTLLQEGGTENAGPGKMMDQITGLGNARRRK